MKKILPLLFFFVICLGCEKEESASVPPMPTAIQLDKSEITLTIGEEYQFEVILTPSDAQVPRYSWYEEIDQDLVVIDQKGKLTAEKDGETTISVTALGIKDANGNNLKAKCKVFINPIEAKSITLDKNEIQLKVGESEKLKYTVLPENTTHKKPTWSSSDTTVVIVDEYGVVEAKGVGEADITASVSSKVKAVCKVKIDPIKLEGIQAMVKNMEIIQGEIGHLDIIFTPSNATNQTLHWSSSDEKIASVDVNGDIVTHKIGECVITAISEEGGFSVSCNVAVIPVPLKGIAFDTTSYKIKEGESLQLKIKYNPENAANKKVTWYSALSDLATVDENGLVKGLKRGTTTIVAISEDGGYHASCDVKVTDLSDEMDVYFVETPGTVINGYIVGNLYCKFTNNSDKTITVTELTVFDGLNWNPIVQGYSGFPLTLSPGESINLGSDFRMVYLPSFVWEFTCEGRHYFRTIQYSLFNSPYVSAEAPKGSSSSGAILKLKSK